MDKRSLLPEETDELKRTTLTTLRQLIEERKLVLEREDDAFLLRFIRGCKYNPKIACLRLKSYQDWRIANKALEISAFRVKKALVSGVMMLLPGRDRTGKAILYFNPGLVDYEKLSVEEWIMAFYFVLEKAMEDVRTQVYGMTAIINMKNFSTKHFKFKAAKQLLNMLTDRIPLRISRVYLVHQPRMFSTVWRMMQPILKEKARDRVAMVGTDTSQLFINYDPSVLPTEIGGNLKMDFLGWQQALEEKESMIIPLSINEPTGDLLFNLGPFEIIDDYIEMVMIEDGTISQKLGMKPKDRIVSINGRTITSLEDLEKAKADHTQMIIKRIIANVWGQLVHPTLSNCFNAYGFASNINETPVYIKEVFFDRLGGKEQAFIGLYQGFDGFQAMEYLGHHFHQLLQKELDNHINTPEECFFNAYSKANAHILETKTNSGASAATVLIRKDSTGTWVYCANVGDVRVILHRDGIAVPLSSEHKVEDSEEYDRLKALDCPIENDQIDGKVSVSKAFGFHKYQTYLVPTPHFSETKLNEEDTHLIIATDTLWKSMKEQTAVELSRDRIDPYDIIRRLIRESQRNGSQNNIGVICITL
eukprot:TRINITY_DN5882_c0_g1_i3.p1 TRINITY_DN5882_c0_g1~~TRINITY_DN5882_c0_g1_i3.p1  ORF type:complete len:641 (-),score=155.39 TRINITY_DN5882_c0_g1_i3:26-1795(-)